MKKNKLTRDIRAFRRKKPLFALIFILLGLVGWILPILPGWLFMIFGLILLFPSLEEKLKHTYEKLKRDFNS